LGINKLWAIFQENITTMKSIAKIFLLTLIISSCNSKHKECKPEIKEYYFHNNSTICEFKKGDSIGEEIMKNRELYDGVIKTSGLNFFFKGNNTVFEYYHEYEQCYSEPSGELFLFQVPSYLDEFKVKDNNLAYLRYTYGQGGQLTGLCDWAFNKGTIQGEKTNDSTWSIKVDICGKCTDIFGKTNDSTKIKYNSNYIKHDNNCDRYIQIKK
jgi:hypothetical protein